MHRFFIKEKDIEDGKAIIKDKDFNHIKNVLRMNKADKIEIAFQGDVYLGEIEEIQDDFLIIDMLELRDVPKEEIEINLFQGLPKSSKMDLIIQKGTEIGVRNFYGVSTTRTVVKIKGDKKKRNRLNRWNTIAEEAAKQSKRNIIPEIKDIISFKAMIDLLKEEKTIIIPYEDENNISIGEVLKDIKTKEEKKINLIIGPEGGFEKDEVDAIKELGGKVVNLGPKILRTETAGFVASTIILYELSDTGAI